MSARQVPNTQTKESQKNGDVCIMDALHVRVAVIALVQVGVIQELAHGRVAVFSHVLAHALHFDAVHAQLMHMRVGIVRVVVGLCVAMFGRLLAVSCPHSPTPDLMSESICAGD